VSGEPKTLTLTLEEALARLGKSDLRLLYVESISLWRVFDGDGVIADGQFWPEAVSVALGVPVVARDEAAEHKRGPHWEEIYKKSWEEARDEASELRAAVKKFVDKHYHPGSKDNRPDYVVARVSTAK